MLPNIQPISQSLYAQETKLGWVLSGSWEQTENTFFKPINYSFLCKSDTPDRLCHILWDLDVVGVNVNEVSFDASKDPVFKNFEESVFFEDGRYTVSLPWKSGMQHRLESNLPSAVSRANSLAKKLSKDQSLSDKYDKVLSEWESLGIIHQISEDEPSENSVFYLPHRPVLREESVTTKVRPVFDISAKDRNGFS